MADAGGLVTRDEYEKMTPRQQGYVCYMQAHRDGSQIDDCCPYEAGTPEYEQFLDGQTRGVMAAQDSEE